MSSVPQTTEFTSKRMSKLLLVLFLMLFLMLLDGRKMRFGRS